MWKKFMGLEEIEEGYIPHTKPNAWHGLTGEEAG